ncbi:UDP-N-acetylglucosamine 2-epimerase (non-hydrolyzing) [Tateyamaria sp.]|nr:UDP-N-acetylglucosamine 2-epimerase (non-hydrolyzing) [Tateyamaria sp.]
MKKDICVIVGTRPGIIMMAPIVHELKKRDCNYFVIHSGQHYSPEMDAELFEDLELGKPDFRLKGVAHATSHGTKTARMLEGFEDVFMRRRPHVVIVNGDANTNVAAALAARKLHIPLAHSEAGERSYDWRMPEEHNRRIMDNISDLLFPTDQKAADILENEYVPGQVLITGNTIVDATLKHAEMARKASNVLNEYSLQKDNYLLLTTHREENVDTRERLLAILLGTNAGAEALGLTAAFPIHPRTLKNVKNFSLHDTLLGLSNIKILPPLRYLDFTDILVNARLIVTDSGGVQQEAFIQRRHCVTVRDGTEWTETVTRKGNRIAGADDIERIKTAIVDAYNEKEAEWTQAFGDGKAAKRIVDHVLAFQASY